MNTYIHTCIGPAAGTAAAPRNPGMSIYMYSYCLALMFVCVCVPIFYVCVCACVTQSSSVFEHISIAIFNIKTSLIHTNFTALLLHTDIKASLIHTNFKALLLHTDIKTSLIHATSAASLLLPLPKICYYPPPALQNMRFICL